MIKAHPIGKRREDTTKVVVKVMYEFTHNILALVTENGNSKMVKPTEKKCICLMTLTNSLLVFNDFESPISFFLELKKLNFIPVYSF